MYCYACDEAGPSARLLVHLGPTIFGGTMSDNAKAVKAIIDGDDSEYIMIK